jgi:hypothetical protein
VQGGVVHVVCVSVPCKCMICVCVCVMGGKERDHLVNQISERL